MPFPWASAGGAWGRGRAAAASREPRPRPLRRRVRTPFLLLAALSRASSRRLLGLLLLLCWLTTHFRMLEATVRRKSSARTQGLAPSACAGDGPSASASHAQPRRPAPAGACGALLPPRGPLGSQALPTDPLPIPSVPTSSSRLCRPDSQPGPPPRPRIHLPIDPEAESATPSPAPPGLWSRGTLTTSACPASSALHRRILPEAPSADSSGTLPLSGGASLEAGSTALSAGGQGSCGPHSARRWLRVPQTQAWAQGWLWAPVTIQG